MAVVLILLICKTIAFDMRQKVRRSCGIKMLKSPWTEQDWRFEKQEVEGFGKLITQGWVI